MKKLTETQWKAALVKALRDAGAAVLSVHGHAQQAPGWPDIYVCHGVWDGWVELKKSDGVMSEAQRIVARKLERQGKFALLRMHHERSDLCSMEDSSGATLGPVGLTDANLNVVEGYRWADAVNLLSVIKTQTSEWP